jgi:long-chain-fatty-acid--[acyl-carrier-protein] ligase
VLDHLATVNPKVHLCEGYGITECSPLVSLNTPRHNRPGTIGRVLPSVTYAVVDDQFIRRVAVGKRGLLLVRGPSIFSGYVEPTDQKPFLQFEGKEWYYTGDYVTEDDHGYLTFCGRKKRFVKIGGEMISLPAIEDVLLRTLEEKGEGPSLAVEASNGDGHPELVLFTTRPLTRDVVNTQLRKAGLSGLHNIRRVIELEQIPVLGTGKTDYRQLHKLAA